MSILYRDEDLPQAGDTLVGTEKAPENIWEQLARAREDIESNKEAYIRVPGYAEKGLPLYAKYRLLSPDELKTITNGVKNIKDRWERNYSAAVDTLVRAFEGFYLDNVGEEDPKKFNALTLNGEPVDGFTVEVANRFGIPLGPDASARSVVLGIFGGNQIAVAQHSQRLQRWMGNTEVDVNEEPSGEI